MPTDVIDRPTTAGAFKMPTRTWVSGEVNSCPHSVTCKCLTNGKQLGIVKDFKGHALAGGGIPACSAEFREILHPNMSDEKLTAMYEEMRGK